jgi:predicted negative regulator of RcsB-dependent stress response
MKEKIKKIFSNKILIIIVVILLILCSFFGVFYFYKFKKELNRNEDFVFDTVSVLKNIYDSRGVDEENKIKEEAKDEELQLLENAYQMEAKISDAKLMMNKWENNNSEKIRKIAEKIIEGLKDLEIASEAFLRVAKNFQTEDVALFSVKLENGRNKILIGASMIVLSEYEIELSHASMREIVKRIDLIFSNSIKNYINNKNNDNFSQPVEIWAIISIRNAYASNLGLSKI